MAEGRHVLPDRPPLALDAGAADKLIAAGNGDGALLYLYILRCGGALEARGACSSLGWDKARLSAAFKSLEALGLVAGKNAVPAAEVPAPAPLEPAEEIPAYDLEDIRRRSGADGEFSALVTEVQRLLGRVLSGGDLMSLFGMYDHLALPPEVIVLLVSHCVEETRARYGENRRVSMRAMEKTAYHWAREEILTLERAEAYLKRRAAQREESGKVKAALGIRDRQLSPTEGRMIAAWLDMGYTAEVLELAYDRTVVNTGALNWKYMDSIVKSWKSRGLMTLAEIEKRDGETKPAAKNEAAPGADDLALLRKQLGMK